MQEPISVLIPVYNCGEYFAECLDSVIGQTYRELEIILVDDGSTDKSGEICDEYAAADSRIRVVHQANGGVSAARNAALAAREKQQFIAWVDADDVCAPDMIECMYDALLEAGADVAQCGVTRDRRLFARACKEPGSGVREVIEADFLDRIWPTLTTKIYRAELFDGFEFPNLLRTEDCYANLVIAGKVNRTVLFPDIKYYYRKRRGSITNRRKLEECMDAIDFYEQLFAEQGSKLPSDYEAGLRWNLLHEAAIALSNKRRPDRELVAQFVAKVKAESAVLVRSMNLGFLGKLELRALCSGRPLSWHFASLCRWAYSWRAKLQNRRISRK